MFSILVRSILVGPHFQVPFYIASVGLSLLAGVLKFLYLFIKAFNVINLSGLGLVYLKIRQYQWFICFPCLYFYINPAARCCKVTVLHNS